jgi:hypothetical protein
MSGNEVYSERSMNGVISVYANDIVVNSIDANSIDVNSITIETEMIVDNTSVKPNELQQLTGVKTTETIQEQIDAIEADLTNVVTITGTQTITGAKTFSNTTTLTGNLNVNSTNITPTELSYSTGLIGNIQAQIDAVDTTGYMDLVTEQTATALKNFSASIQTPSIFNEEVTGTLFGYYSDSSTLLYTSKTGTFAVGSSVLSGIDCVNKTLTSLTTSPNVASIYPDTTVRKSQIYTYQGYITSGNQVYTITTTGLQANQGIQFTGVSDFIGSISGHLITLLNTTGLTPSSITLETSIVQIGSNFYFNTEDNYSLQRFVENANITPPTIVNSEPYTNLYSLLYPAGAPVDTFNRQIVGFNFNDRIYSSDTATKLDMYILDNLTTAGANDTPYGSKLNVEIAGTDSTIYEYSLPPTNQVSQGNLSGFNDGGLFVFNSSLLTSPSTQAVLSNGTDYQAFTSSVDADNEVQLSYSRLQTTASTNVNSYVKDLTGTPFLLSPSNQSGKYVNHNTISLVGSNLGGKSYAITSPNTITPDLGASFLNVINYSPNATTLLFRDGFSNLNIGDWYEVSSAYGFYITAEPQNNYRFTTTNNTADISPTTDITGCIIVNYLGGGLTFLFGTSPVSNSSLSNTIYAPVNNICYTSNTTSFNNSMSRAKIFNNPFLPINYQQPINGVTQLQFITYGNVYYCNTANPSDYQANDIFKYTSIVPSTNNVPQTGKTIIAPLGQTVATALYGFYIGTTVADSPTYATASPTQNLFQYYAGYVYMVAIASIFTGLQPQANDFIRFKDFNGTYSFTYITNVVYVPPAGGSSVAYYKLYTNFYNASWTEYKIEGYFYRPDVDFIDIYRPQTFKKYTTRNSITIYNQTKKYYTPELYNVFNQQTTNLFDTITTTNQFINEPLYFYSNNAYNALTSVEISLPATAIPDEFTVNTFSQTLSNKTFSNDTTFQADIDVVDVRASGNVDCVDLTASGNIDCVDLTASGNVSCVDLTATGNVGCVDLTASGNIGCVDLTATGDIGCVDMTGSGLLDMTDTTVEHQLGDVYIGRQFSNSGTSFGFSVGSSITTLNNYVISRNEGNNTTAYNSKGQLDLRVNNATKIRLNSAGTQIEFYTGGLRAWISDCLNIYTAGIRYPGTVIPVVGGNQIGFVWNGSRVGVAVDNAVSGYFITLSDRRAKKNIVDYEDGLTNIMKLKVKQYNFIKVDVANCDFTENNCIIRDFSGNTIKYDCKGNCCDNTEIYPEKQTGMILDEVREIFPSLVSGGDENSIGTIDYAGLVPHLVKAVQQQQEEINSLKQIISTLNV